MGQYDIPLSMPGGFGSVTDAKAHRNLMSKLSGNRDTATQRATELRQQDLVEISSTPSDLGKDLAAGQGHVIVLSQPEKDGSVLGAELSYNPTNNETRSVVLDLEDSKLTQYGQTFKLEEGEGKEKVTTFFKYDDKRGVVSVLDEQSEVPRVFGEGDPNKLIGKTLQGQIAILTF